LSNTNYLEECFGCDGFLTEANPAYLPALSKRKAVVVNKSVAASDGIFEFIDAGLYGGITSLIDPVYSIYTEKANKIKVQATTLDKILHYSQAPIRQILFPSMSKAGNYQSFSRCVL
jgi:hypothetical protein